MTTLESANAPMGVPGKMAGARCRQPKRVSPRSNDTAPGRKVLCFSDAGVEIKGNHSFRERLELSASGYTQTTSSVKILPNLPLRRSSSN